MKVLLLCAVIFYSASGAVKKCNKGEATAAKDADLTLNVDCEEGVTKCTSPIFAEYTGMTQKYGCGACPTGTKDDTCAECPAEDAKGCNALVTKPEGAKTFKCFSHTYNSTAKKWTAGKDAGTCNAKKDTDIKCNSPGAKAPADYEQPGKGCGPCIEADKTAEKCSECTKESCNSASTLAFVLAPLMAVIFHAL